MAQRVDRFGGREAITSDITTETELDPERELEEIILTRIIRIDATAYGVVVGLLAGIGLFVATNFLILKGGPFVGQHLVLLNQFFIGYDITFIGSLIGFVYAFVVGFAAAYFSATVYNKTVDIRKRFGASKE